MISSDTMPSFWYSRREKASLPGRKYFRLIKSFHDFMLSLHKASVCAFEAMALGMCGVWDKFNQRFLNLGLDFLEKIETLLCLYFRKVYWKFLNFSERSHRNFIIISLLQCWTFHILFEKNSSNFAIPWSWQLNSVTLLQAFSKTYLCPRCKLKRQQNFSPFSHHFDDGW